MQTISLKQIQTVCWIGLTIGIGALRYSFAHRKIRESLVGRVGVFRCPVLSNCCTFLLANKKSGKYIYATDLEFNRFRPFPIGELVWHLSTQVNDGLLAAYITVFDPSRDNCRCFIPFLVYTLVYPIISSNLVTLTTLSPWSDSVCTHT